MTPIRQACLLALAAAMLFAPRPHATAQQPTTPNLGYVYPAGGRQGATFHITAGGQYLRNVSEAIVSGKGVHAHVIRLYQPVQNIQADQRQELMKRMQAVRELRLAEETGQAERPGRRSPARQDPAASPAPSASATPGFKPVEHPLLHNLESKSLNELAHIAHMLFFPREKRQLNQQIGQTVLIEVAIDPDAEPGDRELRLRTALGLTNPVVFQVGQLPDIVELEPNDPWPPDLRMPAPPPLPPLELPAILNGQIMPGDADVFRFRAVKNQQLVIVAHARRLIPYLADTVPGWFEALVTLRDPEGREILTADHYRFDPDPVLAWRVPADGVYSLEIRDTIYRGREDFVYRVALGELPFITSLYPPGGRAGETVQARITGWNLPAETVALDTRPGGDAIRRAFVSRDALRSNSVAYAVDALPEIHEAEPNDTREKPQRIECPILINGAIAAPGDVDVYRFRGRKGDDIAIEVMARRLGSPLDSLLRLTDAKGETLAWNDDFKDVESGLLTHHADARLSLVLPADDDYHLYISDTQNHGGEEFAYRLRIEPRLPDFAVFTTPSGLSSSPGRAVPFRVHVIRKHGFDGEIEVRLVNAPAGFALSGGHVPPGVETTRMTLTPPQTPSARPVALRLEARASINGQMSTRPVIPAEDRMQAFLWTHLVPAEQLLFTFEGQGRRPPAIELAYHDTIRIPVGGEARIRVKAPKHPLLKDLQLSLTEPPEGMSIGDVSMMPDGFSFPIRAGETAAAGLRDNLIVEAFAEVEERARTGESAQPRKRRVPLGVLPAISAEITNR